MFRCIGARPQGRRTGTQPMRTQPGGNKSMTTITTDKSAGREGLRLGNFIVGSVCLLLTMGSAHTGFGANTFWQGGGDVTDVDNWFKPLNWNAGVPTSADNAFINNGPNSGGSSTFSGSPPGTRINASGAVAFIMRVYNTSQLRVDGGDLTIGNILSLGETATSNTGTVYQTGGTVNINAMGIGGWFSPGIGFYNQSGGILNNPGGLYIGNPNTPAGSVGTFNLSGGTVNATGGTVVGGPSGTAVGTVVQSGSSILTTPYLQVYQNGGSATYTFNGGRLNLGNGFLANGSTFIVGDGTQSATLNDTAGVGGPTITFFDGLVIANNGTLMGNGAINANAAGVAINNGGHLFPGSSARTLTPNILGLKGGPDPR